MKHLYRDHLTLKGIALILAMMILLVQFTEAFHHHPHAGTDTRHQRFSENTQFQIHTDCAICHYFAHHYAPVQPVYFCYSFSNTPFRLLELTSGVSPLISGLQAILPNKGPPARNVFAISCTV